MSLELRVDVVCQDSRNVSLVNDEGVVMGMTTHNTILELLAAVVLMLPYVFSFRVIKDLHRHVILVSFFSRRTVFILDTAFLYSQDWHYCRFLNVSQLIIL